MELAVSRKYITVCTAAYCYYCAPYEFICKSLDYTACQKTTTVWKNIRK